MQSRIVIAIPLVFGLLSEGLCGDTSSSQPGTLTADLLQKAAEAAGFEVIENRSVIPRAAYSHLPFVASSYDDEGLAALRKTHSLEEMTAAATDEWNAQQLLKDWVHGKIPLGHPTSSARHALDILKESARGEKFYCTHYAITFAECATALGWQARKLGIDRLHAKDGFGSTHHGMAEIWSNQFAKWVAIDAHYNVHHEKNGIPLSAWEVRAEWLKNRGADVDRMVGAGPKAEKKNPARTALRRFNEDETSGYFWIYVDSRVTTTDHRDSAKLFFLQDPANASLLWYQNHDQPTKRGRLHAAYLKDLFVPTWRLDDVYWTVGMVDATIKHVSQKSIQFALKSYCPNQVGFERSADAFEWAPVSDAQSVEWTLNPGWNTLVLRTLARGNVTGPELTLLLFLK